MAHQRPTKQFVIGVAEAQANDEVSTRRAYFENFIAPTYNVKFIFSEVLKDDAAVKTFIENCIDSGVEPSSTSNPTPLRWRACARRTM